MQNLNKQVKCEDDIRTLIREKLKMTCKKLVEKKTAVIQIQMWL